MLRHLVLVLILLILPHLAWGQLPPVGIIAFYGLRHVSSVNAAKMLSIKPGDDAFEVVKRQEEIRRRLMTIPGVEDAAVAVVCCDDAGKSIVFAGVREEGTTALTFRRAPVGTVRLPYAITQAGVEFEAAFNKTLESMDFSEQDENGYAIYGGPEVRAVQKRFVELAKTNMDILEKVLHEARDSKQRELAAQVIAYSADKSRVARDLEFAMTDADSGIRNEATRGLLVLARYAQQNPRLHIRVKPDGLVRMLNSLVWTDRNKSAGALDALTLSRDPALLAKVKREALDSLAEMARWKSHGQSSFSILGRVAGLSEDAIRTAWAASDHDEQVRQMVQLIRTSRR